MKAVSPNNYSRIEAIEQIFGVIQNNICTTPWNKPETHIGYFIGDVILRSAIAGR